MNPLASRTVWGAVIAVAGWLASPENGALLTHWVSAVTQAAGILLSVIGARSAIAKAAQGRVK